MADTDVQVGRVIRVGRGWADVTVNHKVRRVSTHPAGLIRVGSYLRILDAEPGLKLTNRSPQNNSML